MGVKGNVSGVAYICPAPTGVATLNPHTRGSRGPLWTLTRFQKKRALERGCDMDPTHGCLTRMSRCPDAPCHCCSHLPAHPLRESPKGFASLRALPHKMQAPGPRGRGPSSRDVQTMTVGFHAWELFPPPTGWLVSHGWVWAETHVEEGHSQQRTKEPSLSNARFWSSRVSPCHHQAPGG